MLSKLFTIPLFLGDFRSEKQKTNNGWKKDFYND